MTLDEQIAVFIEAGNVGLLQVQDIVPWADSIIIAQENPPDWIIELSTLNSKCVADYLMLLRKRAAFNLPIRRRIQFVLRAYKGGCFSLDEALQKLFEIVIFEENKTQHGKAEDQLADALVSWDCHDFMIDTSLWNTFEKLFQDYLSDAEDLFAVLSWRPKN